MRQAISLEEEKRRLLEQLESSRSVYRRMLTNGEKPAYEEVVPAAYDYAPAEPAEQFPQSQTMRWIVNHPYLLTAGVAILVAAGTKGWSRSRKKPSPPVDEQDSDANLKKGIAATTFGTTLATTIAMMLRNPAQLQAAMRAATLAMNYYKSRRANPPQRFK